MIEDIQDVTHRTNGSNIYEGTVCFSAEGETYGSESWLLRADDEDSARVTLSGLAEDSIFADPRIDHVRTMDVAESCEDAGIVDRLLA